MVDNTYNASLTALNAYGTLLNNTANNVANINTDNYRPLETTMQDSAPSGVTATMSRNENGDRVDLSKEAVNLITAETGFKASLDVLKTVQKIQKSVIDIIT
jgi:flagellar hook-associated protein FlgK